MQRAMSLVNIGNVQQMITDFGRGLVKRFDRDRRATNENEHDKLYEMISPFERYFVSIQSILIWDDPRKTAIALIGFNCFYWTVVLLNRSLITCICITAFSYNFYRLWSQHIWPEISLPMEQRTGDSAVDTDSWTPVHLQVLSAPEISRLLNNVYVIGASFIRWLQRFRAENHALFTGVLCTTFALTAVIGSCVSGAAILYVLLMTAALGPGIGMYLVPDSWYEQLRAKLNGDDDDEMNDEQECQITGKSIAPIGSDKPGTEAKQSTSFEDKLMDELSIIGYDQAKERNNSCAKLTHLLTNVLESNAALNMNIVKHDNKSLSSSSSPPASPASSANSAGDIRFVHTHFNDNSSTDLIQLDTDNDKNNSDITDDDYEIVSDIEILGLDS